MCWGVCVRVSLCVSVCVQRWQISTTGSEAYGCRVPSRGLQTLSDGPEVGAQDYWPQSTKHSELSFIRSPLGLWDTLYIRYWEDASTSWMAYQDWQARVGDRAWTRKVFSSVAVMPSARIPVGTWHPRSCTFRNLHINWLTAPHILGTVYFYSIVCVRKRIQRQKEKF